MADGSGGGGGTGRLGLPETDLGCPGGGGTGGGGNGGGGIEPPVKSDMVRVLGDPREGDGWGDGEGV